MADTDRPERLLGTVRTALARRFGVDERALAALRVAVALLLLLDLALRSRHLTVFYTDVGVFPRSLLAARYPTLSQLSLHALSGDLWLQVALFVLAGVAALALLVGYRTRTATAASLVLLLSLHLRNPMVLNGGDVLLRRLLFWGLFLPLGGRWSVDAVRADRVDDTGGSAGEVARIAGGDAGHPRLVVGLATAALLAQVVLVYTVNALVKLRGAAWLDGRGARYAFSLDSYTVLLGDVLATHPDLLVALDLLWLGAILAAGLLVVLTGWPRAAYATLLVGLHLGMVVSLKIGVFPLVSVAALLPFYPPVVWDRVAELAASRPSVERLRAGLAWLEGRLPASGRPAALSRLAGATPRASPAVVGAFLVVMLWWNAASLGLVAPPTPEDSAVNPTEFRWDMFAPRPPLVDGWYVVAGRLPSGERVDVYAGSELTWDRPPDLAATYPTARWRKLLEDVRWSRDPTLTHVEFAGYLCHRWNARHDADLQAVTVYFVAEETRLSGPEPISRKRLLTHECG